MTALLWPICWAFPETTTTNSFWKPKIASQSKSRLRESDHSESPKLTCYIRYFWITLVRLKVLCCWFFPANKSTKPGAKSCGFVWLTTKTATGMMWFISFGKPTVIRGGMVTSVWTDWTAKKILWKLSSLKSKLIFPQVLVNENFPRDGWKQHVSLI